MLILSTLESTNDEESVNCTSEIMVHSSPKNAKLKVYITAHTKEKQSTTNWLVNFKCVTVTTHLRVLKSGYRNWEYSVLSQNYSHLKNNIYSACSMKQIVFILKNYIILAGGSWVIGQNIQDIVLINISHFDFLRQ